MPASIGAVPWAPSPTLGTEETLHQSLGLRSQNSPFPRPQKGDKAVMGQGSGGMAVGTINHPRGAIASW